MRRNRVMRDQIADNLGMNVISEIERWSDMCLDPLDGYGVPLDPVEEELQDQTFEALAAEERVFGRD